MNVLQYRDDPSVTEAPLWGFTQVVASNPRFQALIRTYRWITVKTTTMSYRGAGPMRFPDTRNSAAGARPGDSKVVDRMIMVNKYREGFSEVVEIVPMESSPRLIPLPYRSSVNMPTSYEILRMENVARNTKLEGLMKKLTAEDARGPQPKQTRTASPKNAPVKVKKRMQHTSDNEIEVSRPMKRAHPETPRSSLRNARKDQVESPA
ncbi:hypothetical protein EDB83DRAFT_2311312 [Lactarius deliciosus]|nr:hypothetical protein EDB83DRAFT_2311312 [Lactarius deliciosus]